MEIGKTQGKWNDQHCSMLRPYICKKTNSECSKEQLNLILRAVTRKKKKTNIAVTIPMIIVLGLFSDTIMPAFTMIPPTPGPGMLRLGRKH